MTCPTCGADIAVVSFEVPAEYREYAPNPAQTPEPNAAAQATICPQCLTVESVPGSVGSSDREPDENGGVEYAPDFTRVSDAFPTGEGAVPFALALGLCSSLALNREAIGTLLERVELAGTDPLLAIDRLLEEPSIDPAIDLERRRHQLEQVLY